MPRKGKGSKIPQEPGAPNRNPVAKLDAPGQPFGQRQELNEAQSLAPPGGAPSPAGAVAPAAPQLPTDPDAGALAALAQGLGSSPGLTAPPPQGAQITDGMPFGPGRGPTQAQMNPRQSTAAELERLAITFDDPSLHRLATLAKQRGL